MFFLEMWEKKYIWLLIVHEIYMKPNRRYQLSPRISVIVKNPPTTIIEKVIIVKARLDLLASQPTFCKGRKGEKKWVNYTADIFISSKLEPSRQREPAVKN